MTTIHVNESDELDQSPPPEVEDTEASTANGHVTSDADAESVDAPRGRRRTAGRAKAKPDVMVDDAEDEKPMATWPVDALTTALDECSTKRSAIDERAASIRSELAKRHAAIGKKLGLRSVSEDNDDDNPEDTEDASPKPEAVKRAPRVRARARKASSSKRERRSPEQIAAMVAKIVSIVKKAGAKGIRAEDIRKELGVDATKLPILIKAALADKRLKRAGEKRATTYFAK